MVETKTEIEEYSYYCLEEDKTHSMKQFLDFDRIKEELKNPSEINKAFVTINESEEVAARNFLVNHNYYSFSIYKKCLPFREENPEFCFSDCVAVYEFDSFLRNNLQKFTGDIENLIKASIINSLCSNYEGKFQKGQCYLDYNIYKSNKDAEDMIQRLGSRAYQNIRSLPIKHHIENKEGHIPLWVIIPELTFGETTHFIESLNDFYHEKWIDDLFFSNDLYGKDMELYGKQLRLKEHVSRVAVSWIGASWYLRNRSAHYGRIYALNFNSFPPSFYSPTLQLLKNCKKKKSHNRDLFAYMIAIRQILICHDFNVKRDWNKFINKIEKHLSNSTILFDYKMGFPENFTEYLLLEEQ